MARRCPDCEVAMARVSFGLRGGLQEAQAPFVVTDEPQPGLWGRLGVHERRPVAAWLCPSCGLVKLYVDLDDGTGTREEFDSVDGPGADDGRD